MDRILGRMYRKERMSGAVRQGRGHGTPAASSRAQHPKPPSQPHSPRPVSLSEAKDLYRTSTSRRCAAEVLWPVDPLSG